MIIKFWTRTAALLLLAGTLWAAPGPGERTGYMFMEIPNATDTPDVRTRDVSLYVHADWDTGPSSAQPVSHSIEVRVINDGLAIDDVTVFDLPVPTQPGLSAPFSHQLTLPVLADEMREDVVSFTVEAMSTIVFGPGFGTGTMVTTAAQEIHYVPPTSEGAPAFELELVSGPDGVLRLRRGTRGTMLFTSIGNDLAAPVLVDATVSARVVSVEPGGDDPDDVTTGLAFADLEIDVNWVNAEPEWIHPFVRDVDEGPPRSRSRTFLLAPEGLDAGAVELEMPADVLAGTAVEVTVDLGYEFIDGVLTRRAGTLTARATVVATDEPPNDDTLRVTDQLGNGFATITHASPGTLGFADGSTETTHADPDPGIQPFFPGATVELLGLGIRGAGPGTNEREQTIDVASPPTTFTYQSTSVRGLTVGTATNNTVTLTNLPPAPGTVSMVEVFAGATTPANVEVVRDVTTDILQIFGPPQGNRRGPLLHEGDYVSFFLFGTPDGLFLPARDTFRELILADPSGLVLSLLPAYFVREDPTPGTRSRAKVGLPPGSAADLTLTATGNVTASLGSVVDEDGSRGLDVISTGAAEITPGVTIISVRIDATEGADTANRTLTILERQRAGAPPQQATIGKLVTALKRRAASKDRAILGIAVTPRTLQPGPEKRADPLPAACRDVVVDFGGDITRLTLDDRGRAKSDDRRRAIKARIRTTKDGTRTVTLKVALRKLDLTQSLFDEGVVDATTGKSGVELTIPVNVVCCGEYFTGAAAVRYVATQGKKGKLKLVKLAR